MDIARAAFLDECGPAMIHRNEHVLDELFTQAGWQAYAEDLLTRMTNPNLHDLVERVGRDHVRKLGYNDRLYGTMRLALEAGVQPKSLAMGAAAGVLSMILRNEDLPDMPASLPATPELLTPVGLTQLMVEMWGEDSESEHAEALIDLTWEAMADLKKW
jgi:mannitol-1-phosphate/altronate dehydrogenase